MKEWVFLLVLVTVSCLEDKPLQLPEGFECEVCQYVIDGLGILNATI
jgi:hypothetical protein